MDALQSNRMEDVTWLCSLSESELDLLISLKKLVIQRAKVIGHEELANKFDLQMLRALSMTSSILLNQGLVNGIIRTAFVLMEYAKGKVKETSLDPIVAEQVTLTDSCSLLKSKIEDTLSSEEIRALICKDSRNTSRKRPREK